MSKWIRPKSNINEPGYSWPDTPVGGADGGKLRLTPTATAGLPGGGGWAAILSWSFRRPLQSKTISHNEEEKVKLLTLWLWESICIDLIDANSHSKCYAWASI